MLRCDSSNGFFQSWVSEVGSVVLRLQIRAHLNASEVFMMDSSLQVKAKTILPPSHVQTIRCQHVCEGQTRGQSNKI